nr:hypothetical protein [Pseudomonadota bacterium]
MALAELQFSDVYIRLDEEAGSLYRPLDAGPMGLGTGILPVLPRYEPDLQVLRKQVLDEGIEDGSLTYEGMPMRVSRQAMANDEIWACLRRIRKRSPRWR